MLQFSSEDYEIVFCIKKRIAFFIYLFLYNIYSPYRSTAIDAMISITLSGFAQSQ